MTTATETRPDVPAFDYFSVELMNGIPAMDDRCTRNCAPLAVPAPKPR